jgi:hypothetical protein
MPIFQKQEDRAVSDWRVFATAGILEQIKKKAPAVCRRLLVEAPIVRPRLEFKHGIETDRPLMSARVLLEWRGVVQ